MYILPMLRDTATDEIAVNVGNHVQMITISHFFCET